MAKTYSRIFVAGNVLKQMKWSLIIPLPILGISLMFGIYMVIHSIITGASDAFLVFDALVKLLSLTVLIYFIAAVSIFILSIPFIIGIAISAIFLWKYARKKMDKITAMRNQSLVAIGINPVNYPPKQININTKTIDNHGVGISVASRDHKNTVVFESGVFTDYIQGVYTFGMTIDNRGRPAPPAYYELYCVLSIKLKSLVPHIFFDSDKTKGGQARQFFEEKQEHSFEGDFDKHFHSYVAPGQAVDSLSVITPDVMQALVAASGYDIELVGDRIQIYAPLTSNAAEQFADMKQKGELIANELNGNIVNFGIKPSNSSLLVRDASRVVKKQHVGLWVAAFVSSLLFTLMLIGITKWEDRSTSDIIFMIVLDACLILLVVFMGYMVYKKIKDKENIIDQNQNLGK